MATGEYNTRTTLAEVAPVPDQTSPDSPRPTPPKKPPVIRRTHCRRYGCGGKLEPMIPDPNRYGSGFDAKCEACGCPDWTDTRRK